MNITTIIQTALTALNSSAELFLLEEHRANNEELEHTGDTIVVFPDWKTENSLNQGLEVIKTRKYNMVFKTIDEWDNSLNKIEKSYDGKTSLDRIEEMEVLADSVFSYITAKNEFWPEIQQKLKWRYPTPILKSGNGTMSGVKVELTVVFSGNVGCDFNP